MKLARLRRSALATLAVATALSTALAACGSSAADPGKTGSARSGNEAVTLTVYTDQHASLVKALTDAYTKDTGVKFKIQNDATVGQIQAEGSAGKADVFLSEDPGPVAQLGAKKLVQPVDKSTLDQVRPGLSSPAGNWVAYAARARVLFYNPSLIPASDLPKTLADLLKPQYKGKFAWAPSGAFVATAQYLIETQGLDMAKAFLQGLKDNGVNEHKNGNVRDTVEAGKHAMGLSNHYYWWILAGTKGGPDKLASRIYHFPTADAGNLVLSSGAAILKSSKQQAEAQKFLAWLTSKDGGQQVIADDPSAQYPVAPGLASKIAGDLGEIKSPTFDMDKLADSSQAEDLLKQLGMSSG